MGEGQSVMEKEMVGDGESGDLLQDGHHQSSLDAPRTQEGCLWPLGACRKAILKAWTFSVPKDQ